MIAGSVARLLIGAGRREAAVVNDAVMTKPGGFAGVTEFWDLRKPVIVAVNGAAVGGGFKSHSRRI